ncbi:hypothetical protein FOMPIDRAFT_1119765, partial [Fomitopsis schrenkii]
RHEHRVHVRLDEETRWGCDRRRDQDLLQLPFLTEVTAPHVPGGVRFELGPPESLRYGYDRRVNAAMAYLVVTLAQDMESSFRLYN